MFSQFLQKLILASLFFISLLGLARIQVQAQDIQDLNIFGTTCLFENAPGCDGQTPLLESIQTFAVALGNILAVLVIMYGGYKYFFSGISEGVGDGKNAILAGVIGLAIINLAPFIAGLVAGEGGVIQEGGNLDSAPIENLLANIRDNILFPLASVVAVIVIIWGGYQYMFSSLPESKADGLSTIRNGAIGLVVVLIAFPIANTIENVFTGSQEGELQINNQPIVSFIQAFLINILIPVSTVVTVFFIILGGYYMITAQGDPEKFNKGRTALVNAVIGLIVVLLSSTIVGLIILFVPVQ